MPRVIAGTKRGIPLKTLAGDKTRPTADRTKEAIFSSLGPLVVSAKVLDICAGSGQLGIEALSRGATSVVFIDQAKAACVIIRENLAKTSFTDSAAVHCRALEGALKTLAEQGEKFDLVFFDPPYALADRLFPKVAVALAKDLLSEKGIWVMEEASKDFRSREAAGFLVKKQVRYGAAMITYYELEPAESVIE